MKEFGKLFSRRYSAVCVNDDVACSQLQSMVTPGFGLGTRPDVDPAVVSAAQVALQRIQRRKSLTTNRSMKPIDILGSFFYEPSHGKRNRVPTRAFLLLAIGFLAIATATLVKVFDPYNLIFKWKLIMTEGGEIFNLWAQPPVDLYIKIYLFNITNAEAFLAGQEQLKVEQVGPYVYKEIMTHENVTFNTNNTMSSTPSHPLVWQAQLSGGYHEDDEVVMLNIAMLAISHLTATQPFLVRMALKTLLVSTKSEPIVRTTAKEFMFGYPSALATLGNTFLPNWIPFEKVGLIDRMYDFSTDFETFYTGVPNPALSGLYATYRGETNLPQWEGNHCSNIEFASDGTKFKSFMQSNETVKFFRKSMCRPINLYRVGEEKTYGRLKGYSYVFEDNAFDNGETNKANKCFCRKGDCQPVGLIDVTDCYYGFPISLSFPHFMNGDLGLQENITGVNPDPTKHSSAFVIQPESGLPLSLSVKMQINMHFKDLSNFPTVSKFSYLTTPMLWFEIMMTKLPDYLDSRFNFYLNILPLVNPLGFWIGLLLGISLLGYAITRATLHISNNACRAANISKGKYGIENLNQEHRCGATNPVYSPCEMKLLGKLPAVNRNVLERSVQNSKLCTMNPKPTYALDMEPALLDACESTDVVQNCNNITPSRKSTTSHQKVVLYHDDDDKQIEFFSDNPIVSNF
ncbi:scavenger receptor class B member 1 isoform X1 [Drosophila biarmipes]|uniref:scavenger receptor class B member 1 isoform X1 n=1 Tax=Drosophila biarmipes TaxID=125945 RepID=UPI001CDACBBF|nr:scavenger receptor class B member 1 isoform X1 [Drosophila biarmipes]XP_050746286.1 scavenger receptor class B member 1 isoform X1 [Drosophila biarmipes]XP_050746287.1 scavenger receptor class B member 1 isoform X1 [Drosophila biarmipes]XP_050746288.1 scavenger receptor class B member 1 isoform X1 [Drosophila biarmipes]XP_050746289.1 scavenger receptor class B member 1 isoform X1 [Drosophila biarmipes]